jgi:hypothetical protein
MWCRLELAAGNPRRDVLLGAVFTFSAWCAVAAIDPTPRTAL